MAFMKKTLSLILFATLIVFLTLFVQEKWIDHQGYIFVKDVMHEFIPNIDEDVILKHASGHEITNIENNDNKESFDRLRQLGKLFQKGEVTGDTSVMMTPKFYPLRTGRYFLPVEHHGENLLIEIVTVRDYDGWKLVNVIVRDKSGKIYELL